MSIEELYSEIILDHCKRPRNYGVLPDATVVVRGENASCGDDIQVSMKLSPDRIEDIRFTGHGCAICMASASLMSIKLKNSDRTAAGKLISAFRKMLTEESEPDPAIGDLQIFSMVSRFPQRVKCATLAWHAAASGLAETPSPTVSTD